MRVSCITLDIKVHKPEEEPDVIMRAAGLL